MAGSVHIFGVRHHGPGCARSLRAALAALAPDIVLVEGPPDGEAVLPLAIDPAMKPPVALLIYPEGAPQRAAYYPFAAFSPEWQAIHHALTRQVPLRFMDLPLTHLFADEDRRAAEAASAAPAEAAPEAEADPGADPGAPASTPLPAEADPEGEDLRDDPLGILAEAAGYTDRELWWEHQVEQRQDPTGLFEGILEAMTAIRSQRPPPTGVEALREAYMRKTLREAQKAGHQRIAVVCGAWHGPALVDLAGAKADQALLKGLGKVKVIATWIPWTSERLSQRTGYGAGVDSPGWYEHLFEAPDRAAIRWVTRTARLLREQDLDASSANVIEAVRLAEMLAALRDIPLPGLAELREAIEAVLCHGQRAPLDLVRRRLELGDALGEVPAGAPRVPLAEDLALQQKQLRLKPSSEIKDEELDLRGDTHRGRSLLLHRLALLDVPWGSLVDGAGTRGKGTFREIWRLQWRPELAVAVIEANVFGNTIEAAASARVAQRSLHATLAELTQLLQAVLPAALTAAIPPLLARIQAVAALTADVRELMRALPSLAALVRYGDVRGGGGVDLMPVAQGLVERIVVGLAAACAALDDEAALDMQVGLGEAHEGVRLLDVDAMREAWLVALRALMDAEVIHPRLGGRACRLRLELGDLDEAALSTAASLALSPARDPAHAAAWIEGLLRGSSEWLIHSDVLWGVLDAWLAALPADAFVALLPPLRRAFADFDGPQRRRMADKVRHLGAAAPARRSAAPAALDPARAALAMPILAHVLGVPIPSELEPPVPGASS